MNCQEFENLVHSLVKGRNMDLAQQTKAFAHTESCSQCLSRLQNERQLARFFQALRNETQHRRAPAGIESTLLEALRRQRQPNISRTNGEAPVRLANRDPLSGLWKERQKPTYRQIGLIAAACLLLLGGAAFFQWRASHVPLKPADSTSMEPPSLPASIQPSLGPEAETHTVPQKALAKAASASSSKKVRPASGHSEGKQNSSIPRTDFAARKEIDTSFLPVMAASPLEPTEWGHLVRMELPRSTMGRFGFTISAEHGEEPIQADVFVGEDGIARAIRFVDVAGETTRPEP
ncbi:MAG: hypothetical protein U0V70_08210 [Terriglobia bacterium]